MSYRVYEAVHPNPDGVVAIADQGVLAFLELWVGIIVACMPTMAPIFVNYIFPLATKLTSKINSTWSAKLSSRLSSDRNANSNNRLWGANPGASGGVSTFGRSGLDSQKRRRYSGFMDASIDFHNLKDDASSSGDSESCNNAGLRTECEPVRNQTPPGPEGIYVKQEFQSRESKR